MNVGKYTANFARRVPPPAAEIKGTAVSNMTAMEKLSTLRWNHDIQMASKSTARRDNVQKVSKLRDTYAVHDGETYAVLQSHIARGKAPYPY